MFQSPLPCLYKRLKDANVVLTTNYNTSLSAKYYSGSGFILRWTKTTNRCDKRSYRLIVITSAHVVLMTTNRNPMYSYTAAIFNVNGKIGNNHVYPLRLLGVDPPADLAVLEILPNGRELPKYGLHPSYKLGNNYDESEGQTIYTIGNPLNLDSQSVTAGVLRDFKYTTGNEDLKASSITISAATYASCSGSPIFNSKGRVIGILSFGFIQKIIDTVPQTTSDPAFNPTVNPSTNPALNAAAFCGGTGAYTIRIIIDHILGKLAWNL